MILVIDNYDSFTWNLVQYLGELGADPYVRHNDGVSIEEVRALRPRGIVISPGPCSPAEAGVSVDVVRHLSGSVPILGVCLGHQAIGVAFGGKVVEARRVMHGKVSKIRHCRTGLFRGLTSPLRVARYHSLVLDAGSLPPELTIEATTREADGSEVIQAIRHRMHPIWGVQFHPESIASEGGHELLRNFLALT